MSLFTITNLLVDIQVQEGKNKFVKKLSKDASCEVLFKEKDFSSVENNQES